jgi:outer membrane protein assembly factor BamB
MKHKNLLKMAFSSLFLFFSLTQADDWPQLQHDSQRTGRTQDEIAPPYQVRWMWFGEELTLRNSNSNSQWPDDLSTKGQFPMPGTVSISLASSVQPIVFQGKVFIGDQQGKAYAIDALDGTNLWTASNPGGTITSAAVGGNVVVFTSLRGTVTAYSIDDGSTIWQYKVYPPAPVRSEVCIGDNTVFVTSENGVVHAIDLAGGANKWNTQLNGLAIGGLAYDQGTLIKNSHRVRGQTFRSEWPVVWEDKVYFHTGPAPHLGSEYMMEDLMAGAGSFQQEENEIYNFLQGDARWSESGEDWRHFYALNTSDMSEPFVIPNGPSEGCGTTPEPPVVDNEGRVLTWWKTRYPTLADAEGGSIFGTNYSMDIAAVDPNTGKRVRIDNGSDAGLWPLETDNLYAMSVAGNYLFLRQNFRGTQAINLTNSSGPKVQVQVRVRDGGDFSHYDISYVDATSDLPGTPARSAHGRMAPSFSGSIGYFTESYCITAFEHRP